ncbi:unnamed protein product [Gongylonema pulchrum]|uniref:Cyclin N-terminal domain-containing protein n=1 Tax=Gongylonema pulchrum TaxID=637853 RepID=A0A183DYW8_9BILA|nr:unnamed protein product [Gongylonema pulchrum]
MSLAHSGSQATATALHERQSSAVAAAGAAGGGVAATPATAPGQKSITPRWIFNSEELRNVASVREGMPPEEELNRRRVAASTIHQMADRLNHESRVRISQLCICAAMMHMHRFFVFHSFFKFDPRDIAAACLFLAGKSEECPRKLDHVVRIWWSVKFPHWPNIDHTVSLTSNVKTFDSDDISYFQRLYEASQLIVTLENLVLQTIDWYDDGSNKELLAAFDLSVDIPHPYVLMHMQKFARVCGDLRTVVYITLIETLLSVGITGEAPVMNKNRVFKGNE